MNILLMGPLWGNALHGAEPGIYDALLSLGHKVSVWDYRKEIYRVNGKDLANFDPNQVPFEVNNDQVDVVLCPGAGLPKKIINSSLWNQFDKKHKVIWNSEPIRLEAYKNKILENKKYFNAFFTFDESEIELYKSLGINAEWLPQAFNPKWYKPLQISKAQKFSDSLCFIGSVGGKWGNRQHFLQRIAKTFKVNHATIFDGAKVNQAYNIHAASLNLGLYIKESGPAEDLKAFGLQQRIFESIGAGAICITNKIESNELFQHEENILFYNKDNLEEIIAKALDNKTSKKLKENILQIRELHTYEKRMEQLVKKIGG